MTNASKDKDKIKEETISARNKINECKKIDDKEKQIGCIYELLHNITEAQDITNLTLKDIINDSEDPRWMPMDITNDANAIILGISEVKGLPKYITRSGGYVEEKMNSLTDKWYALRLKYKIEEIDKQNMSTYDK